MRTMDAVTNVPVPANEPVRQYPLGSQDRAALESKIKELASSQADLTMTIGGHHRLGGGELINVVQPHNHHQVLGRIGNATDRDVSAAIDAAAQAAPGWRALSFDDRAAILLKAEIAGRAVAVDGQRGHDPGSVQVADPG